MKFEWAFKSIQSHKVGHFHLPLFLVFNNELKKRKGGKEKNDNDNDKDDDGWGDLK